MNAKMDDELRGITARALGVSVVDKPRSTKRRPVAVLAGDDDATSRLTAYCIPCGMCTPMRSPKRKVTNGVAVTVGKCLVCKGETYRVGKVRSGDEGDAA